MTQPEEIRETKKFFEWILLFRDGFFPAVKFSSAWRLPYPDDFCFEKKALEPYFVEDFLPSATPETIILLRPSSKTKESLKY